MQLWDTLVTGLQAQRRYFTEGRQEIAAENLATMQIAGAAGGLVAGIFFLIAPRIIPSWCITTEYIFIVPVLAAAFLFAFFYSRRRTPPNPLVVEVACALFYILLLMVLIALSVFPYPGTPQIFVSLCFMFMPALLIQRPRILLGTMAAAEIVFIFLALRYKTPFSIENDIFNTLAAFMFSLINMITANRLRSRNYASRAKLEKLSQTDALTRLLNKTAFEDCAAAYLLRPEAASGCALLVLDLDDFKQVNDQYGHPFGDAFLAAAGTILQQAFRQTDLAGRIGGDEFAMLLPGALTPALLEEKCALLLQRFADISIDGVSPGASCSIGVALSPDGQTSYPALFRVADEALYQAKRGGKSTFSIRTCY